jgi:hypothetical protein
MDGTPRLCLFGFERRVILCTRDREFAIAEEIRLIAELKTQRGQPGHWGANLTSGGEGNPGRVHSPEERRANSDRQRGNVAPQSTRSKMSLAHKGNRYRLGVRDSLDTRAKKGKASLGQKHPHTEATKERLRQVVLGQRRSCPICRQPGHYSKTCPKILLVPT